MNRIITVFAITIFQQSLFAQTDVKGTFSQDARWTIQGSPYNVTGNVGIPDGVALTIDPGVVINFNTNHQIIVQGALVVNGTGKEPVVMNGNQTGAAMLLFQKTNLSKSSMTYVTVKGPKNGIEFGDFDNVKNTGRLVINRLKLSNSCIAALGSNNLAVIEVNNSDLTNSRINNAYKDEAIVINNSKITGGEITAVSPIQTISLNEDTCYNTIFNFTNSGMLQADRCLFYNVRFGPNGSGSKLVLKSSWLFNSGINLWGGQVNMTGCAVSYDANYKESYCIRAGYGLITSSDFTGNGNRTAIDLVHSGYFIKFIAADCEFRGFKTYLRGRSWNSGKDTLMFINHCNFMDSISDSAIINTTKYNINASNNWWGSSSDSLIVNSIHDFWDDIIYGKVIYTGYLSSPILKKDALKIHSVSMVPANGTTIDFIKIMTKTNLPGYGKRVFRHNYLYHDTMFIDACYSAGIGLTVISVADTFDVGYLTLGDHPIVYRATLSGSSEVCSPLQTEISHTSVKVNPPSVSLFGVTSLPASPVKGDHIKIATSMYLANTCYGVSKTWYVRNDTIFLGLCKYALATSRTPKLYKDTFDLGYLDPGDFTIMLSVNFTLNPDSCIANYKTVFKSKLTVWLARLTNCLVTTLPQKPVFGDVITVHTEVKVSPFGKLLYENHFIRNDTIYVEHCYYAGSGAQDKVVKSSAKIGKLASYTYSIRFIVHLSPDSNLCKPVNTAVYDIGLSVYTARGLNSLSSRDVTLSPNPFNDQVSVNGTEIGLLEIYDLRGQLIKTFNKPNGNLINGLSSLPPGLFIFQVTSSEGKVIRKKMVKN